MAEKEKLRISKLGWVLTDFQGRLKIYQGRLSLPCYPLATWLPSSDAQGTSLNISNSLPVYVVTKHYAMKFDPEYLVKGENCPMKKVCCYYR